MFLCVLNRYDFEQGVKFQLESDIAAMKKVGRYENVKTNMFTGNHVF